MLVVQHIIEYLRNILFPTDIGTPPVAVLCVVDLVRSPSEFEGVYKKVYRYEVLGRLHSVTAWQELAREFPGRENYQHTIQ